MSLRSQMLLLFILAVIVTTLTAAGGTYVWARREVDALLDYQLRQHALAMSNRLQSPIAMDDIAPAPDQHLLVQIWDLRGGLAYFSQSRIRLPRVTDLGFSEVDAEGDRWRVYSMSVGPRVIEVAQRMSVRHALARDAAGRILLPVVATIPPLTLLIWFLVGRMLAPTRRLASTLRQRNAASLVAVPTDDLPEELIVVVDALNHLIERINGLIDDQRAFVADAAHELRTPLTAIRLQAQLLARVPAGAGTGADSQALDAAIHRMSRMVDGLLALARLDAERDEKIWRDCDFSQLVVSVVDELRPIAADRRITLACAAPAGARVAGDAASLHTMLSNLVDNAVRYTPEGGNVSVSLATGTSIVLTVSDSGPGIPAAERARVFDRFYRIPGSGSTGSGLGLAIVKRITELHDGRVALAERPGGGAEVIVTLPAASGPPRS